MELTTKEVVKKFGISRNTLQRYIRTGKVTGELRGNYRYFNEKDIEGLREILEKKRPRIPEHALEPNAIIERQGHFFKIKTIYPTGCEFVEIATNKEGKPNAKKEIAQSVFVKMSDIGYYTFL